MHTQTGLQSDVVVVEVLTNLAVLKYQIHLDFVMDTIGSLFYHSEYYSVEAGWAN